jgi:hypothetical protein
VLLLFAAHRFIAARSWCTATCFRLNNNKWIYFMFYCSLIWFWFSNCNYWCKSQLKFNEEQFVHFIFLLSSVHSSSSLMSLYRSINLWVFHCPSNYIQITYNYHLFKFVKTTTTRGKH